MPEEQSKKRDVPLIEKLIAAGGLLLVLAVVGSLGYEAVTRDGSPPDIEVKVNDIQRVGAGYRVRFSALNHGETTGAQVRIKGELKEGEKLVEESVTILTYVPDKGKQEGGLFFEHNPGAYRLQLRASGYEKP
jgi:uncharacterized protein (TIGR02588 family)